MQERPRKCSSLRPKKNLQSPQNEWNGNEYGECGGGMGFDEGSWMVLDQAMEWQWNETNSDFILTPESAPSITNFWPFFSVRTTSFVYVFLSTL